MKYAVFSDLHGNIYALKKMLQDTHDKVDGYIFLGDVCGYYIHQQECIELLQTIPNLNVVRGNHDDYYLQSLNSEKMRNFLIGKYGQSYNRKLSSLSVSFLKKMQCYCELLIDGLKILCVHGGPKDYLEERIYPNQISKYVQNIQVEYDMILNGHTHYALACKMSNGGIWINPGSLGQPRDGNGFIYCIIDFSNRSYKFQQAIFSIQYLLDDLYTEEKGSPVGKYLKKTILKGEEKVDKSFDVSGRW